MARAEPQSPILTANCPSLSSCTKRLWLFRSRWMIGGLRLCRYAIPSATSIAMRSRSGMLSTGFPFCEGR